MMQYAAGRHPFKSQHVRITRPNRFAKRASSNIHARSAVTNVTKYGYSLWMIRRWVMQTKYGLGNPSPIPYTVSCGVAIAHTPFLRAASKGYALQCVTDTTSA